MAPDPTASVIDAIGGLIGTVVWPLVVLVAFFALRKPLERLIAGRRDPATGPAGLAATLTTEAEAAIVAATVARDAGTTPEEAARVVRESRAAAEEATRAGGLLGRTVLWVDDRPDNSRYEHAMLGALGVSVVVRTSVEEALSTMASRPFDMLVADLQLGADQQAGFGLLEAARAAGHQVPCVFYVAHATPDRVQEATRRGAGLTNQPTALLRAVARVLAPVPAGG
ncbi:response regulator [Pseudonocardia sp. CA-107938]|uniref:response regulator n=1 Tax=Pseudonocardia sp. CA-107938 TaxID=3240021 RepID=UPI003D8B20D5